MEEKKFCCACGIAFGTAEDRWKSEDGEEFHDTNRCIRVWLRKQIAGKAVNISLKEGKC